MELARVCLLQARDCRAPQRHRSPGSTRSLARSQRDESGAASPSGSKGCSSHGNLLLAAELPH